MTDDERVHIRALLEMAAVEAGLENWKRLQELDGDKRCDQRTKSWVSITEPAPKPSAAGT